MSRYDRAGLVRRVVVAVGSGIAGALAFPPRGVVLLLPVAFGGLVWATRGVAVRYGVYLGFAFGVVYFGASLSWMARIFGPSAIPLWAILALFPAAFGGIVAWWERRGGQPASVLVVALAWTATEYFRAELFVLRFGWCGFGYATVGLPAVAWLLPWVGCYGVTYLVAAVGAALVSPGLTARRAGRWAVAAVWTAAVASAWLPRGTSDAGARARTVRLVQAPSEDEDSLFRLSRGSSRPVDLIVWPEYSLEREPSADLRTFRRLQELARRERALVVLGAKENAATAGDPLRFYNTAYVMGTDGQVVGKHHKNHPVHFYQDGASGSDATPVVTPVARLGVAICFDMDFQDVARRLAADGAQVFIVPNLDAAEWGPVQRAQHGLMFRARAAECGRWLARSDVAGGTSVVDDRGVVVARVRTVGPAVIESRVALRDGATPYVQGGWLVGPGSLAGVAVAVLGLLMRRPERIASGPVIPVDTEE